MTSENGFSLYETEAESYVAFFEAVPQRINPMHKKCACQGDVGLSVLVRLANTRTLSPPRQTSQTESVADQVTAEVPIQCLQYKLRRS